MTLSNYTLKRVCSRYAQDSLRHFTSIEDAKSCTKFKLDYREKNWPVKGWQQKIVKLKHCLKIYLNNDV